MIDYFALALGHGLIAIALLRLVQRDALDHDPVIEDALETARKRARRPRKRPHAGATLRSSSVSGSAENARSSSVSDSAAK